MFFNKRTRRVLVMISLFVCQKYCRSCLAFLIQQFFSRVGGLVFLNYGRNLDFQIWFEMGSRRFDLRIRRFQVFLWDINGCGLYVYLFYFFFWYDFCVVLILVFRQSFLFKLLVFHVSDSIVDDIFEEGFESFSKSEE